MTSYLKKGRLAALAGLASLAVFAVPAAPAGATTKKVCTTITAFPYNECHRVAVIHLSASFSIINPAKSPTVNVTVKVSDPRLIVKLYKAESKNGKYRLVKTVFNHPVKAGVDRFTIHVSTGSFYELNVTAKVRTTSKVVGASKTVKRFFHPI